MLAQSSENFGTAMTDLNIAVGEVQRFVADNQEGLVEGVARLADATEVLTTKRPRDRTGPALPHPKRAPPNFQQHLISLRRAH